MTHLTIEVTPDLQRRLEQSAAERGLAVSEYARAVLEATVLPPPAASKPEDAPADLEALAADQGAPLAARFEDLLGDFWPEDETADDFITAVREWRREGASGLTT
jgi:hypothetical protein